jgi:hypothetical protein
MGLVVQTHTPVKAFNNPGALSQTAPHVLPRNLIVSVIPLGNLTDPAMAHRWRHTLPNVKGVLGHSTSLSVMVLE